jgi:hydroxypyruvate isomerase
MPRFAANLTTMYQERSVPERFAAAAEVGFKAVEFLQPYQWPVETIREWLEASDLQLILINTAPGLPDDREVGLAAVPGREADFKAIFRDALEYAVTLGVDMIHVLAGRVGAIDADRAEATFLENIQWAASQAARNSLNILLEPLNSQDVPDYLYTSSAQVARLIEILNVNNVRMQYDFYHMQIMEGNLAVHLSEHLEKIGHIQFSSVPGRHEPQYGEVNLHYLFAYLDRIGYKGWIGCEYTPKTTTEEGLSWARDYGIGP